MRENNILGLVLLMNGGGLIKALARHGWIAGSHAPRPLSCPCSVIPAWPGPAVGRRGQDIGGGAWWGWWFVDHRIPITGKLAFIPDSVHN